MDPEFLPPRGRALCAVACALAQTDPHRALRIALSIGVKDNRDQALRVLTWTLAKASVAWALRVARHIESWGQRSLALLLVACCLAPSNQRRASRLIEQGLRMTRRTKNQHERAWALTCMLEMLPVRNRQHLGDAVRQAVEAARRISDDEWAHITVLDLLEMVARHDALAALEVARAVRCQTQRVWLLATIAAVVGDSDRERGEQIADDALQTARAVEGPIQDWALGDVAEGLARINLRRALALARSIKDRDYCAMALESVADALAETDPTRALRVARTITDAKHRGWALLRVVLGFLSRDPAKALRVARSMPTGFLSSKALALEYAAEAFARTNQRKALAVARSIRDPFHRARALAGIAAAMLKATGASRA